jgi:hypothetical protein
MGRENRRGMAAIISSTILVVSRVTGGDRSFDAPLSISLEPRRTTIVQSLRHFFKNTAQTARFGLERSLLCLGARPKLGAYNLDTQNT